MVWISCGLDEHVSRQALERFLEWGQAPQTPWLRGAARHYAFRQAEPTDKKKTTWFGSIVAWIVVVWLGDESRQGFEENITSSRTHGLDQLWLG